MLRPGDGAGHFLFLSVQIINDINRQQTGRQGRRPIQKCLNVKNKVIQGTTIFMQNYFKEIDFK